MAHLHTALALMPKPSALGHQDAVVLVSRDAHGNVSPGLHLQLGPSPIATCMAITFSHRSPEGHWGPVAASRSTHLTEMENSPGALSLSRIRKAPTYLRLRSSSSATCREILPAYHLPGAPLSRMHPTATSPPSGMETPRGTRWEWSPHRTWTHPQHFPHRCDLKVSARRALCWPCKDAHAASPAAVTASCSPARCLVPCFPPPPAMTHSPIRKQPMGAWCRAENPMCWDGGTKMRSLPVLYPQM